MSLPTEIVDSIFAKLAITYGHRFLSIWDGMPLATVKADWGLELRHVRHDRILWALQNLPERAPDAPTFRQLCARMPEPDEPTALPYGPKRPAPAVAKAFADSLHNAPLPTEPERVVWARAYIAKWSAPDACPTITEREWLVHARRIVERYDTPALSLDQIKAETTQRVEAYQEGQSA